VSTGFPLIAAAIVTSDALPAAECRELLPERIEALALPGSMNGRPATTFFLFAVKSGNFLRSAVAIGVLNEVLVSYEVLQAPL
jgi:hypothetical protein